MKTKKIVWFVALAVVLFCGIYGFMAIEQYDFLNSLFFTILMFVYNFADYTTNIYINIARFGAMLLTAAFVISILDKLITKIKDYFASKSNTSTFVFGDNELSSLYIESAKSKIINRDYFVDAKRFVLLSDDDANMEFYNKNSNQLKNKEVYIKNASLANTIKGKHKFFSLDQIAAREFWRKNSLVDIAFIGNQIKDELNIAVVGFTELAEHVLYESLIVNIFDPKQTVNYHVIGDDGRFERTHINAEKLNIKFYKDDVFSNIDVLEKSDIVLFFLGDSELLQLTSCLSNGRIIFFTKDLIDKDVYLDHKYGMNSGITIDVFNYNENICTEDNIIGEQTIKDAKKLNANYNESQNLYQDLSIDEQWLELSSFHRMINIACVDYYKFTTIKLLEKLTSKPYYEISDNEFNDYLPLLSELEHIRWNNYHFYCNWTYAPETDKKHKKHNCLIGFNELSIDEQDKDKEQVLTIRQLMKYNEK